MHSHPYFRLYKFSEDNSLLPEFQFGFRQFHSTSSATLLLRKSIEAAFNRREKVYSCMFDLSRAFDSVNRQKLCIKLQKLGIPTFFCRIIFNLLSDLKLRVRSNGSIYPLRSCRSTVSRRGIPWVRFFSAFSHQIFLNTFNMKGST